MSSHSDILRQVALQAALVECVYRVVCLTVLGGDCWAGAALHALAGVGRGLTG
jgi:hypothetical protein